MFFSSFCNLWRTMLPIMKMKMIIFSFLIPSVPPPYRSDCEIWSLGCWWAYPNRQMVQRQEWDQRWIQRKICCKYAAGSFQQSCSFWRNNSHVGGTIPILEESPYFMGMIPILKEEWPYFGGTIPILEEIHETDLWWWYHVSLFISIQDNTC